MCAPLCPTLCDLMYCSPPGSSVLGILQARIPQCVDVPFSRGIFPTQGSNPGVLHCRQSFYHLSQSPIMTRVLINREVWTWTHVESEVMWRWSQNFLRSICKSRHIEDCQPSLRGKERSWNWLRSQPQIGPTLPTPWPQTSGSRAGRRQASVI